MYLALVSGLGLRGLVYANAAASAIAILLNVFFFFRYFRLLDFSSWKVRLTDLRESLRYSKDIFIIAVSTSVHMHFDKMLLSSFLSLNTVSTYEVASRVIQQMRQIPILLLNPILPAASELQAQERHESISELYHLSLKYIVALCVPLFVCVGVFASPLVELWLGKANGMVATTLQILILPNFLNLMTGPAYFISLGIGKTKYGMYSSIIGLALNVALSFILLRLFGYFGAVGGTLVALSFEAVLFAVLIHHALGIQWTRVLNLFLHPLGAISVGLVAGIGVGYLVEPLVLKTILMVCLTLAVYLIALVKPRYFNEKDQAFFREVRQRIGEKFLIFGERS
jgi:O-antigen/teichoic acid export membrane protein